MSISLAYRFLVVPKLFNQLLEQSNFSKYAKASLVVVILRLGLFPFFLIMLRSWVCSETSMLRNTPHVGGRIYIFQENAIIR